MSEPVRVLLVDDHDLVRGGLAAILSGDDGIEVVAEASDGPEAVRLALDQAPDLVLMDIEMPGGDGLTATTEILARCPDTKVLVLTTFDLDEYVYLALRAGACGFMLKTSQPSQLIRAIRDSQAGELLLSPSVTHRLVEAFVSTRPTPPTPGLATLTTREMEVLREIATGRSNAEIAETLHVSEGTVKTHVTRILAKLHLRDRVQAVVVAYETGLVSPRSDADPE